MSIEYFLVTFYIMLSFWLIPKLSFIRHSKLTSKEIRLLLAFKIIAGVICAFYFERYSTNVDYLAYNRDGKIQYNLLLSNPVLFFTDFKNDINSYGLGGLFESKDSFWAYLRFNLLYKFIAIVDLISFGNFFLNTIIFSTIVFFGHIAFYRTFSEIYKKQKYKILFASFCLPSLLLYTSCIHKDGIVFLSLGIFSYVFYKILENQNPNLLKYFLFLSICIITIFLFRNYVIIALVPAMLTAILCKLLPFQKRYVILITYAVFFILFFLSGFTNSLLNLPEAVVQRKADFATLLGGKTNIPMNDLKPTIVSFIINFPQAFNHFAFRPYLWEFPQTAVLLTAIELFVYQLIVLAFVFYEKKQQTTIHSFNIFGLTLFFNMALIIGYTIPNIGAIVRYRSIFWVFLICPILCNTDWRRLFSFGKTNNS